MIHAKLSLRGQPEFERILLGKKGALSIKTEKEKEEDEKLMKKAKRDSRQAIYISLAAIAVSLFRVVVAFVKAYQQLK